MSAAITAQKREYPSIEGWKYLTVTDLKKNVRKQQVINNLTHNMPQLYDIPFYLRENGTAYIIIRKKPVLSSIKKQQQFSRPIQ